jgi:hypothetical protein
MKKGITMRFNLLEKKTLIVSFFPNNNAQLSITNNGTPEYMTLSIIKRTTYV